MALTESTYQLELLGHQEQTEDSTGDFPATFRAPSGHCLAGQRYHIVFDSRIGVKDEKYDIIYDALGQEVGVRYTATIKSGPILLGGVRGRVTGTVHVWSQPCSEIAPLHHAVVNAGNPCWHGGLVLDANTRYRIVPSPSDHYTINGGATAEHFYGAGTMDGAAISIPANPISLGGLNVLVWHHQPGGAAPLPEIISFFPGTDFARVSVGGDGGSMHFIIGDLPGAYGDNSGLLGVDVYRF